MIVLYILLLIIALVINFLFAAWARDCAEGKGHEGRKWFHLCFWLGIIPYILVAALPDVELQHQQQETNRLLRKLAGEKDASPKSASRSASPVMRDEERGGARHSSYAPARPAPAAPAKKACPHCGANNSPSNTECWVCHEAL